MKHPARRFHHYAPAQGTAQCALTRDAGHRWPDAGSAVTAYIRRASAGAVCRLIGFLAGLALLHATAAMAQETVGIELNKLEARDGGCRAYVVFKNNTASAFQDFKLDLVMFDHNGVINRRLAVDAAPLRVQKTSVKLFDIEGLPCEEIGLILVNDVLSCRDDSGERDDCVTIVEPTSRGNVSFVK